MYEDKNVWPTLKTDTSQFKTQGRRTEGTGQQRRRPQKNAQTSRQYGRYAVSELERIDRESEKEYQEYLARKRKRQEMRRRQEILRRRQIEKRKRLAFIGAVALLLLILINRLFFSNPVLKRVTVEAGTTDLKVETFLKKKNAKAEFVTDMSKLDLGHVGEQNVVLKVKNKERTCRMTVQDTIAPKAEAVTETVNVDGTLKPEELVKNIEDSTDVTCTFKEEPDLSEAGSVEAVVILNDEGGNTAEVTAKIKVMVDKEAPKIEDAAPLTAFVGDTISYKANVKVTDNCDKKIKLEVDNSDVDPENPGVYDLIYTATDRAGNMAEEKTRITIKEKPENFVELTDVQKEADAVLAGIITDDMTKKEKAEAIYNWVRSNLSYVNSSEKESWTNGAYQGFTTNKGDCFIYYATAKALLEQVGIPNIDVEKSDTSHSRHYWSLVDVGDGWYHFDTTPRQAGGRFFLLTDDEILEYSKKHKNSHIFDRSLYPATPKEDSTIE